MFICYSFETTFEAPEIIVVGNAIGRQIIAHLKLL